MHRGLGREEAHNFFTVNFNRDVVTILMKVSILLVRWEGRRPFRDLGDTLSLFTASPDIIDQPQFRVLTLQTVSLTESED